MKNPTLIVVVILFIIILLIPVTKPIKVAISLVVLSLLLYLKRGYLYLLLATRAIGKNPSHKERAFHYYKKAAYSHLPSNYTIMIGNIFTQRTDATEGLAIYNFVIEREKGKKRVNTNIINSAQVASSMALWALGMRDEAITLLQRLRSEGYFDGNLAINLGTFLLDEGDLEGAQEIIEQSSESLEETPALADNRGYYLYLTGEYTEAYLIYMALLQNGELNFPEVYYHGALVAHELGKNATASKFLDKALTKQFYTTSTVTVEMIELLLETLPDRIDSEADVVDAQLALALYDEDYFDDSSPNTEIDDEDEIEPNIELDPEDWEEEFDRDYSVEDEEPSLESSLFEEEYDDEL